MKLSAGPLQAVAVYASQKKAQYMKWSGGLMSAVFQQLKLVKLIFPAAQTLHTCTEQHRQIENEIENVWKFKWNDKVMLIN